jgi:chemotaxis methyl-accepting protein methylase
VINVMASLAVEERIQGLWASYGETVPEDALALDAIMDSLRRHTGLDVREYRRASVARRILNRMITLSVPTYALYAELIEFSEQEAMELLGRVSIKVSEFYRNPDVFDELRSELLPRLAIASDGRLVRVWSAGCARGEEAWTLAMLLHEAGINGVVEATDIDATALSCAKRGRYSASAMQSLPAALRQRYVTTSTHEATIPVDSSLRAIVRFSVHDLLADVSPPGDGAFDLICCRNVLIFFQRSAQERIFHRLTRSLAESGMLCVGEAEWPAPSVPLRTLSSRSRVFQRGDVEGGS